MGRLPTGLGARPASVGGLIQEQDLGEVVTQPRPGLGSQDRGQQAAEARFEALYSLIGERLKGFEPTTFCMASSP